MSRGFWRGTRRGRFMWTAALLEGRAVCVLETPGYARPLPPSRVAVLDSGGELLAESAAATATVYYDTAHWVRGRRFF